MRNARPIVTSIICSALVAACGGGGDGIDHGAGIPGAYGVYTAVTEPSWVEYQPY